MAKVLDDATLKERFDKWRSRFVKIAGDAAKENLDTGARKKERLDKLFAEVKGAGLEVDYSAEAALRPVSAAP